MAVVTAREGKMCKWSLVKHARKSGLLAIERTIQVGKCAQTSIIQSVTWNPVRQRSLQMS